MKHTFTYIIISLFILLPLFSCSTKTADQGSQPLIIDAQVNSSHQSKELASSYYYYMLSRLHNNKELPRAISLLKKAIDKDPSSVFLKKELLNLYLVQNNNTRAMEFSEEILESTPDDIEILFVLAKLKTNIGKKDEGKKLYYKILELKPDNKNIYLLLGKLFSDEKNYNETIQLYSRMIEHFPDSYIAHYYLGVAYLDQNKLNYAEEEFLKTIELKPKLIEPRLRLIDIYKKRDKSKESSKEITQAYKNILKIDKDNDFVLMEYALYLYNYDNKKEAEKIFFNFGEKSSKDEKFLLEIANKYIVTKQFQESSIIFVEMLKASPENSSLNFFAGYAFDSLKQYQKAIEYYKKVQVASQYYKKSIIHMAFLLKDKNENAEGMRLLEKYHKSDPKDIDIIIFLSSFYVEAKKLDECVKLLKNGLTISKDNPILLYKLGICMDKSGKKDECIKIMEKVIKLDPEHAEALNYLGYTYAELGIKLDLADKLISRALVLKPDDGYITDSLGWVYYQKGAYVKASKLLKKAAEMTSYDPIITEHLGDSYTKENRLKQALLLYKKALKKLTAKNEKQKIQLQKKIKSLESKIDAQK